MSISTHILDASTGKPAGEVKVLLKQAAPDGYTTLDEQLTNADGRISDFAVGALSAGDYQLTFMINAYFSRSGTDCFYPKVSIDFTIADASQHFHVPLLISPYSYSTYRGS